MAQTIATESDLFIDDMQSLVKDHDTGTTQWWDDFWSRWFICRYSSLPDQITIAGGFGPNEDGPPSVHLVTDDIVDRDLVEGGSASPERLLEDVIADLFEIHELDEVENAIRAAVERGISKGRALYPE